MNEIIIELDCGKKPLHFVSVASPNSMVEVLC